MKDSKHQVFKDVQITMKDQTIRWETYTIPLTGISRFWSGERPKEPQPSFFLLLLIFLTAVGVSFPGTVFSAAMALIILVIIGLCELKETKKGVNIELSSGEVCTFLSEQEAFSAQVCDLLGERVADREGSGTVIIRFDGGGSIEKEVEEVKTDKPRPRERAGLQVTNDRSGLAASDLLRLYDNVRERENPDEFLLDLIEETLLLVEENNSQEAKKNFSKFIELGLIHQCNELGLNALLGEIKSCVY